MSACGGKAVVRRPDFTNLRLNVRFSRKRSFRILESQENEGPLSAISGHSSTRTSEAPSPSGTRCIKIDPTRLEKAIAAKRSCCRSPPISITSVYEVCVNTLNSRGASRSDGLRRFAPNRSEPRLEVPWFAGRSIVVLQLDELSVIHDAPVGREIQVAAVAIP